MTASLDICKFGESIFRRASRAHDKNLSPFPVSFDSAWGAREMPRVALLAISVAVAGCAAPPSSPHHAAPRRPPRRITRRADNAMAVFIFNFLAIVIGGLALAALGIFGAPILRRALAALRATFLS
jgi:hypothetical protein